MRTSRAFRLRGGFEFWETFYGQPLRVRLVTGVKRFGTFRQTEPFARKIAEPFYEKKSYVVIQKRPVSTRIPDFSGIFFVVSSDTMFGIIKNQIS